MVGRKLRGAAGVVTLAALIAAFAFPLSVVAATFSVTLEKQVIRGEEGDRITMGEFATPSDMVGQTCGVTATGNNNESVHPGNDIEVTSETTVILAGVEDSANKNTTAAGTITLSDSIVFTLVLGPDGVYSAELDVTFDCQPATTTSTTSTSTTTTQATSTTDTSTTTSTTTTIPPEVSSTSLTSTTAPPETSTTSTIPPEVSSTTLQSTTTTGPSSDTLPFTGAGAADLAAVAYGALATGIGLVLLSRRRSDGV